MQAGLGIALLSNEVVGVGQGFGECGDVSKRLVVRPPDDVAVDVGHGDRRAQRVVVVEEHVLSGRSRKCRESRE